MRICHVTSAHPANDPRIAHKEALSACKAGHDVTLVAPDLGFAAPPEVRLITVPRGTSRLSRMLKTSVRALSAARRTGADLYHLHDPELLVWLPLFRLVTRGAVIFDVHESVPDQIMSKAWIPAVVRPALSALTRIAMRTFALCASGLVHAVPHTLRSLGRRDETLARNFPVLETVSQRTPHADGPVRVVYVGAISPIRGSVTMLEACSAANEVTPLRLSLIGRVEPESHLEELRRSPSWPIVDRVERVDYPQVPAILAGSDVGLAVLKPVPNYLISYPTKVFEYVAAGLWVVVSDFPLWRELFAPLATVSYVDAEDVDAVAKAIVEAAVTSRSDSSAPAEASAYVRAHLSWEGEYENIEALYARVTTRA